MKRTIFRPFKPFFPVSQHKQTRHARVFQGRKARQKHHDIIRDRKKNRQKKRRFF